MEVAGQLLGALRMLHRPPLTRRVTMKADDTRAADGHAVRASDVASVVVRDSLPSVLLGLAILYTLLAPTHYLVLTGTIRSVMVVVAAASAVWCWGAWVALRRQELPPRFAHVGAAAAASIVLVNSTLHLTLSADPAQTGNLLLFIVGIGFLFLSTPWLIGMLAATVLCWIGAFVAVGQPSGWSREGFAIGMATLLAVVIHRARLASVRRLQAAREQLGRTSADLDRALTMTRQSGARFRRLADASAEGVLIHESGTIVDANEAAHAMFGANYGELTGMRLVDLVSQEAHEDLARTMRMQSSDWLLVDGKRGDGILFAAEVRHRSMPDFGGSAQVTTIRNISERLHVEEERQRFFTLSLDLFCVAGFDGFLKRLNPAWIEATGYTESELLTPPLMTFIHPDDREVVNGAFSQSAGNEAAAQFESRFIRKDGAIRWLSWVARPYPAEGLIYAVARDITQARRDEEERRRIIAGVRALLWRADVRRVNGGFDWQLYFPDPVAAQRFLPIDQSDGVDYAQAWARSTPPEYRRRMDELAQQAFREGWTHYSQEYPCLLADGRTQWLNEDVWVEPVADDEWQLVGVCTDITERKVAQDSERLANERIRAIMDYAIDAIITIDEQGTIIGANAATTTLFGYSESELIGTNVSLLMPAAYRPKHLAAIARYLSTRVPHVIGRMTEVEGQRKGGETFPVELTIAEIRSGPQRLFTGIARDVTQRRRAEDALRESEERYRDLFENAQDLIQSVLPDGSFDYVNRAWRDALGYGDDDVASMNMMDVIAPEHREHCLDLFRKVMAGAHLDHVEVDFVTKSGARISLEGSVNCRMVRGSPVATRAIFRDITERKALDRMKDEFVSTVSHELRTPLTSIFGALGLLTGGAAGELGDTARKMLDIAYSNAERLIRLVNDILDMQKLASGGMEFDFRQWSVSQIVKDAIEQNRAYADRYGVLITCADATTSSDVRVDRDRVLQVMANLLSNAAKFSPEGGTVAVEVLSSDSRVTVRVSDSGPGIPEEFQSRIFQRFAQADSSDSRAKGGTGLGLSIVKAIVDRLGGEVGFETEAGVGTTFYFALPSAGTALHAPSRQEGVDLRRHVLMCSSDENVVTFLTDVVEAHGMTAHVVATAKEAREQLMRRDYTALILDIVLPDQSGVDLLRRIRSDERTRRLPVVVVSATTDEAKRLSNGGAVEIVDWIPKPIEHARLAESVREAARRRSVSKPRILHVEDDGDVLQVVAAVLEGTDVTFATTLREARELLASEEFHLILLDIAMPDGSGFELLPEVAERAPEMPVIVFSAGDVGTDDAARVAASLVKSRTTNEQLASVVWDVLSPRADPGSRLTDGA